MAGLYIHVPFCGQLCTYCDFHFTVSLSKVAEMVEAMRTEMRLRNSYLNAERVTTLYFGGGTPSILSIDQLSKLIQSAQYEYRFDVSELAEFTIECNPEDLSLEYLQGLRGLGVTRLSIGVQSFNDSVLRMMNRRHDALRALRAVNDARDLGFANVSIDLIFGVPGCSDDDLRYDLAKALSLGTQHLSVYHLTIEDKTVLGWKNRNGVFAPVDDMVSCEQYKIVERELIRGGFNHYEISNYALPGYEAVHNSNYWNGVKYVGIGPSAHSYDGVSRQWNVAANSLYMDAMLVGGAYFEREELSVDDMYNEYVMTSLRTASGLSLSYLSERFGDDLLNYFLKEGGVDFNSGMLRRCEDRVSIDSSQFLLSDSVISRLMR